MKVTKFIDNERLRIWWYSKSVGWHIHRKSLKPLGFIFFVGHIRLSVTLFKPKMILFNPYTLQRIGP